MEIKEIISSGLLEIYATGLASKEEAQQVEQWKKTYPEVEDELLAITTVLETYAQVHAIKPGENIKQKIFDSINPKEESKVIPIVTDGKNSSLVKPVTSFWKIAAAASVILLIGSIALNISTYNKYNEAEKGLVAVQQRLDETEEKNRLIEADMNVVQSKYSVPVALHGLEAAPDAVAKVFWMKNTGEVFIDPSNLPETPTGKQYQLWAIVDGKPVDGGMIISSKKGDKYRIQKMKTFGRAEAFAVTLENEKGNPTPKGPMFVMGKM